MKRLLLILIVIFIFPNNVSAKDLDVQVVSKNSNGIILSIHRPLLIVYHIDFDKGRFLAAKMAKNHCKSYSKKVYSFYSKGNSFYALDKYGTTPDHKSRYGYLQDLDETTYSNWHVRFFCAKNETEARKLYENVRSVLPKKFASIMKGGTSLYINNHEGYFDPKVAPKFIAEKPKEKKPKKKKPKIDIDDNKIIPAGSGSGFFVSKDGHVITNFHVIEGCDINKINFKGTQSEAKVLAVDKVNDIAILKSNAKPNVVFSVSNEDVSLLEDVIVAGFPLGKQISSAIKTHKGVVTALAGAGDNYSYFQTDAAINQGNSGGPIINQKGNVVGIAVQTWVEEGVQGVHFGIKSSTLKTFASANGLSFESPNYKDLSNKDLGKLITNSTIYIECHMTVAKIKKMLAEMENKKAFFKEHK